MPDGVNGDGVRDNGEGWYWGESGEPQRIWQQVRVERVHGKDGIGAVVAKSGCELPLHFIEQGRGCEADGKGMYEVINT